MKGIQTDGLILRAVDFGESDRILHLLIPDSGRLTAIARAPGAASAASPARWTSSTTCASRSICAVPRPWRAWTRLA
jgi:hypothetical protein